MTEQNLTETNPNFLKKNAKRLGLAAAAVTAVAFVFIKVKQAGSAETKHEN